MAEEIQRDAAYAAAIGRLLDELGVPHRVVAHRPILTVEEGLDSGVASQLGLGPGNLVKCLRL